MHVGQDQMAYRQIAARPDCPPQRCRHRPGRPGIDHRDRRLTDHHPQIGHIPAILHVRFGNRPEMHENARRDLFELGGRTGRHTARARLDTAGARGQVDASAQGSTAGLTGIEAAGRSQAEAARRAAADGNATKRKAGCQSPA
ncbi:hypothetical protein LCGC14_1387100 [marine sediment metagenome]|uniref:Uncharacterized protein n=1 Tax=marine sediment metagenome TaxID=412755 RepID=A0A0F9K187_9ZZZZ